MKAEESIDEVAPKEDEKSIYQANELKKNKTMNMEVMKEVRRQETTMPVSEPIKVKEQVEEK